MNYNADTVKANIKKYIDNYKVDLCDRLSHEGIGPICWDVFRDNGGRYDKLIDEDQELWSFCWETLLYFAEKQDPEMFQILTGRIRELTVDEATKVTKLYECIDALGNFWRIISNKLVVAPGLGSHGHGDSKKMYDISTGTFQLAEGEKSNVMIRFVIDNKTTIEAKVFVPVRLIPVNNKFDILNVINQ